MKKISLFLLFTLLSLPCLSQYNQSLLLRADSLFERGVKQHDQEQYEEALSTWNTFLQIEEIVIKEKLIDTYFCIASCYSNLGNNYKAIEYLDKILPEIENNFGKYNFPYLVALAKLAENHIFINNVDKATIYLEEILMISEKTDVDKSIIANILSITATAYREMYNYTEANKFRSKAIDLLAHSKNDNIHLYIKLLKERASDYLWQRKHHEAITYLNEYRNVIEQNYGNNNPNYYSCLTSLADCYLSIGNNKQAIDLSSEAFSIAKKIYDEKSLGYADALFNLGSVYLEEDPIMAIELLNQSLELFENNKGKNSHEYIHALIGIGACYAEINNNDKASICLNVALNLCHSDISRHESKIIPIMLNLAACNYNSGYYSSAYSILQKTLNRMKEFNISDSFQYVIVYSDLSNLAGLMGNYEEAIEYCNKAIDIHQNNYGKMSTRYALLLCKLSDYYAKLGNYDIAIDLATEGVNIIKEINGREHDDYITSLSHLTDNYFLANNYPAVIQKIEQINPLIKKQICKISLDLLEKERNLFLKKYDWWLEEKLLYYVYSINDEKIFASAYDGILLSKGILLNMETEIRNLIKESGDNNLLEQYDKLKEKRLILDEQYKKEESERIINADSLSYEIEELERYLVKKSKVYGDFTHNLNIGWKDVRNKLKERDLAVEFVSFPLNNNTVMYSALLLKKEWDSPKMINLFEKKRLDAINKKIYYCTKELVNIVWKPLEKELDNVDNVYFAPSGELYNIAIESLPHWSEDCLMSDKWNLYRLSSTRQIAQIKEKKIIKYAALYGGLKYDTDTTIMINNSKRYQTQTRYNDFNITTIIDSLNMRAGASYLPATREEALEITETLQNKCISTGLFIDSIGTESSFKSLSGSGLNLLHIATHGFYWLESEVKKMNKLNFISSNEDFNQNVEDKALTRSGLLFAGANHVLSGKVIPKSVDDGVLTAKEISTLDFRQLDLVVLSACQTGLGEITGDGVFGLQRGFKKAGANSLLMSLWKVDDDATRLLMIRFYKNLTSGKSKYESLREAQEYVRNYEVEVKSNNTGNFKTIKERMNAKNKSVVSKIKKYQDPYYWAAFILLDAI